MPALGQGQKDFLRTTAFMDVEDVLAADMLVRFSDNEAMADATAPSKLMSAARMFEFGLAWANGKPIVVVGGIQNVFDHLPNIVHVKDTDALEKFLVLED